MKWFSRSRLKPASEHREAEQRYEAARTHIRVLVHELDATLQRIEDKRERGLTGDA